MTKLALLWVSILVLSVNVAAAQTRQQFGGDQRADAATRAIILGVQQGISTLPPTSGQAFVYEYDPQIDTYVPGTRLGPTALRSPDTLARGTFSIRLAATYFALAEDLGPIDYRLDFDDREIPTRFAKFGVHLDAKVGLFNVALTYGLTGSLEVALNVPIVVVDAEGAQLFSADPSDPLGRAIGSRESLAELDRALVNGEIVIQKQPFRALGFDFNDGTRVGVGRISVGAKVAVYSDERLRLSAQPEFYFPSPSEDEFAGSNSAAILPRLVGGFWVNDWCRVLTDVGYDYDFDVSQLRRFVWNFGASLPLEIGTFDLGIGGSNFDTAIAWTPRTARAEIEEGRGFDITVTTDEDNTLGTNLVDFLGGVKVRLFDDWILSGTVNVPLTDTTLRPAAVGTIAIERYL